MAYPGASLLRLGRAGFEPVALRDTAHFRMLREFCIDPNSFIAEALADERP